MNTERTLYLSDRFCAVEENGRLVEYIQENPEEKTGAILRGRVERIMASLQCAFVDIGRKKSGFLPLRENSETFRGKEIRSGDRVLVQIRKEEKGDKGAFLSRDLTLAGSGLLLMPMNRFIGVSARVSDEAQREALKRTGEELLAEKGLHCGIVMRAAALSLSGEELREERDRLWERWEATLRAPEKAETGVVLQGNSIAEELMNDYGPRGIVRVDRSGSLPADLQRQLKEAQNRKIHLPHGGNIVIDPCEALTVIDVNSASDSHGGSRRQTIVETNLEACREIALQTRLRNLSGILILDLIDMDEAEDQDRVLQELSACFSEDRMKTVIHGMTRLGLVEITRKRARAALAAAGTPESNGKGELQ